MKTRRKFKSDELNEDDPDHQILKILYENNLDDNAPDPETGLYSCKICSEQVDYKSCFLCQGKHTF